MSVLSIFVVFDMIRPRYCFADIIQYNSFETFGNYFLVIGFWLVLFNILLAFIKLHKIKMSMPPDGSDAENHNVRPFESGHSKEK